ncbi:hypothetical protein BH09ACT11_BH09ACT11_03430 [soil metagenome]
MVIRRLVPGETGPTGGPAFTDVLGICLKWGETVEVETTRGLVSIDRSLIVSGKPVPPRPVRRPRA